ncbi:MAG TPA: sigma-70 family RNA polymerase sigma factor [Candidatus Kapabacteria bacterium]|nr:sigma-70 family RNA polymerase sigma factor [Candidatus Kapabacteria bacterium]
MEQGLIPDKDADRMAMSDASIRNTDSELDFASLPHDAGRSDSFEYGIAQIAPLLSGGNRSNSFARSLRVRSHGRLISNETFEQIAIERSDIAFSEFYEHLAPKVYSFVFRILRVEDDALDVLQDAFSELWAKAPDLYNIHTNLAVWVLYLARNLAFNQFRTKHYKRKSITDSYEPERHENLIPDEHTPEEELTTNEARAEIKHAIEKLKPEQRKSIELVFFADLTRKAAAEKLHLSYQQFQSIFYDSLAELEHELFPYLGKKATEHQPKVIKKAFERKREAMEAKQDARARAKALRKFVLGLPFADERDVL